MATKQSLPKIENNTNPGYLQSIFAEDINPVIDYITARLISHVLLDCCSSNYKSSFFKSYVIHKLEKDNLNPMWVCVNESPNAAHIIYELDVNGTGTGIYLQILGSIGIYNVYTFKR